MAASVAAIPTTKTRKSTWPNHSMTPKKSIRLITSLLIKLFIGTFNVQLRPFFMKALVKDVFLESGFITAEFPLEKFDDAMALIGRGEAFKVILKP